MDNYQLELTELKQIDLDKQFCSNWKFGDWLKNLALVL